MFNFVILLSVLLINVISGAPPNSPCGDWEPFKDDYCYKIFNKIQLESFHDAQTTCQLSSSSLVTIHNAEEQNFIANFLFNKSKVVDTVWIGGKFSGNSGGKFRWNHDDSEVKYTNWAVGSPKNLNDYCIQMQSEVGLVGKWTDEPCAKKNLIVCQKRPNFSLEHVQDLVFQLKKKVTELEQNQQNTIPIGFVYVQLPKEKSPKEIWPSMTWTDVSSEYSGIFFRVEGGDSAKFGQIQEGAAPIIEKIQTGNSEFVLQTKVFPFSSGKEVTIPRTGWSNGLETGKKSGNESIFIQLKHANVTEVRPKNMAVRVWKRTG